MGDSQGRSCPTENFTPPFTNVFIPMFQTVLSRSIWFVVLFLLQVLVFNHVHIFGYATPMPYVYFLLILPSSTPRWLYVMLGFLLGLFIDVFTNTPGIASGSLSLVGLLTPVLLNVFSPSDRDEEAFEPSHKNMEWGPFLRYVLTASLIHCLVFFCLEAFSFFDWQVLIINICGSTLLTSLFIVAMELVRSK